MHLDSLKHALRLTLVSSLVAVALVATPPTASAAVPCARTFSSGTLNAPIPEQGAEVSDIDVPDDGLVVTDLDVTLDILHPEPADLEGALISVDDATGSNRALAALFVSGEADGPGENMRGTILDDAAANRLTAGEPPFTGRFRPRGLLSGMNGHTGGRYRLVLFDDVPGVQGTLVSWSIKVTADCDADGDGVLAFGDSCPRLAGRTASGCPVPGRRISSSYRSRAFRGTLSSSVSACRAQREVLVRKARPGADRTVGTTRTRADGTWRLRLPRRPGRYYATSPRVVAPGIAECPAVTSARFRIR